MKKYLIFLLFFLLTAFQTPAVIRPFTYEYQIISFEQHLILFTDRQAIISERIVVNYAQPKHGLIRDLPSRAKLIALVDQNGEPYEKQQFHQNNMERVKIGSGYDLVKGEKIYLLQYSLPLAVEFKKDHDAINLNVTGEKWDAPIHYASFSISLPTGALEDIKAETGYPKINGSDYKIKKNNSRVIIETTRPLKSGGSLRIKMLFKKGFFVKPGAIEKILDWFRGAF